MPTCPKCKLSWGRSDEEHNLLFGVIELAFKNWPHDHQFRPTDEEHLRSWLAIETGHTEALDAPDSLAADPQALVVVGLFFSNGKKHFRMGYAGDKLVLLRPLSMKKKELPVEQYRTMADRIYGLIEDITGVTPEQYKAQRDKSQVLRVKQAEHRV